MLWSAILAHRVHHCGQLTLMCRLAGGQPPGLYGPNREEMAECARGPVRSWTQRGRITGASR